MYRLMIVDDEYYIRKMLTVSIPWADIGYTLVAEAEDGLSALALIEQNQPDAILVDINIPRLFGLELIERIASQYPYVSIVILSAYDKFSYAQSAVRMGVFEYLLKPIDPEAIVNTFIRLQSRIARRHEERATQQAEAQKFGQALGAGCAQMIKAVQGDIRAQYADAGLSLGMLAEKHHINKNHLCKVYKQIVGRTIIEDLIEQRLTIARRLIEQDPNTSISEVSRSVGYADPLYFSKAFRRRYGVSPQQCRAKHSIPE